MSSASEVEPKRAVAANIQELVTQLNAELAKAHELGLCASISSGVLFGSMNSALPKKSLLPIK